MTVNITDAEGAGGARQGMSGIAAAARAIVEKIREGAKSIARFFGFGRDEDIQEQAGDPAFDSGYVGTGHIADEADDLFGYSVEDVPEADPISIVGTGGLAAKMPDWREFGKSGADTEKLCIGTGDLADKAPWAARQPGRVRRDPGILMGAGGASDGLEDDGLSL